MQGARILTGRRRHANTIPPEILENIAVVGGLNHTQTGRLHAAFGIRTSPTGRATNAPRWMQRTFMRERGRRRLAATRARGGLNRGAGQGVAAAQGRGAVRGRAAVRGRGAVGRRARGGLTRVYPTTRNYHPYNRGA